MSKVTLNGSFAQPTKNLCTWKSWKLLLSPKQVPVSVGQLSMELLQLGEPLPYHHLLHVIRMPLGHELQAKNEN